MTEPKETEIIAAGFLYEAEELKLKNERIIDNLTYRADEPVIKLLERACNGHINKNVMIIIKVQNLDPEDK
jgi:hypothetical protein